MAGIIPDNFSVDMGQQLMSNIVNLYAQKQQLDEKRKLEDERYKREQQIWNERQTSTEEREKRMAEYNLGLQTEAQTSSAINKLLIDTSANLYNGIQSMIQRAQTDEAYRKELESNGMSIDKMREITIEKLIRNGIESFDIGQKLVDENLMRVNQENVYNAILKITPQERLKLSETLKTEGKTITDIKNMNELNERLIKLQPLSTNISASVFAEKGIENQIKKSEELLSNPNLTKEQSTELQNILFKLRNNLKKPKSNKTQSGGTKSGKESIDYQNQYNSLNKSLQEAKNKGNESLIKSIENKIVNVKADAAKNGINIKENQTNISTQIKSNPIIQNAVNAIYSEQKKGSNFNADIIKKSLQTIESNYNPESASSIENFILKNKSRFEEALNLWGDARKSDAITRLLREFEEKNKQSQQPTKKILTREKAQEYLKKYKTKEAAERAARADGFEF